ncbi:MAG TPA: hypothetical protein VKQ30_09975, partial [Ktedonobacterales bacterium]|nr:hypothetical protein [Ktedonobacterales bacterium]
MQRASILRRGAGSLILSVVFLVITACGSSTTAKQSQGWIVYHDNRFPFALPIPPDWHVSPITNTLSTGATCDYTVRVFPPDAKVDMNNELSQVAEQVYVRVILGCDRWPIGGHDEFYTPEPKPITISAAPATMYDSNPNAGWPEHVATAQFGGHEYLIGMRSPTENAQRDLATYLRIVQGFQY